MQTASAANTLHPLAWWVWGIGCIIMVDQAATLPALLGAAAGVVAVGRLARDRGPWSRALEASLGLAALVVVVRVGFYVLIGLPDASTVLVRLPGIHLPAWLSNITLLGPVHAAGLTAAVADGVTLGLLIVVFGAVNAIAHPRRALRSLPTSLHHLGTAAVIAVTAVPQLFTSAARVRRAQRLRGGAPRGIRALAALIVPVLAGALDQALSLAASMDSRGYARAHAGRSRLVPLAVAVALLAAVAGSYGLLDPLAPQPLAAGLLIGGMLVAALASLVAARSVRRTRYRLQPWSRFDSVLVGCGALVGAVGTLLARPQLADVVGPVGLTASLAAVTAIPLLFARRRA